MLLLTCVFVIFSSLGSNNLFIWLLGTLAYFLKPGRFRWTILIIGTLFAGIGGLFSALGVANASQKLSFAGNSSFHREYFLILLGLGVSISLPVIVRLRPRGPSLERINRYGSGLAAWSYSLYLIHRPILYLWSNFHDSNTTNQFNAYSIVMYLVKIGSCLAGGWLFWLLFEGRTDQVRRLLKKKCFLSN